MRKWLLLIVNLLVLAVPAATHAVEIRLQMGFPAVLPPLVEIQPGVQVVQDFDQEVFFTGGYYWVQRDGNWYRARDHQGTWSYVRRNNLPASLAQQEPGRYRNWQHDEHKSWPDAQNARGSARHWKPADHQEMRPAQTEHRQERQRSDNHDDERRGERHDERH